MVVTSPEVNLDLETETYTKPILLTLTPEDQAWLEGFGVNPAWQNDTTRLQSLNELIVIGSLRLDGSVNQDRWQHIVSARIKFLEFVGISDDLIDEYQSQHPTIIPLDTFIGTQRVMHGLGLDAVRVVNVLPAAISYAPESVRDKMVFLRRSARLLQWQNPIEELVNTYPALLGFSTEKLAILRRIAARHVDSTARTASPSMLPDKLIVPLEKYIIALSRLEDDQVLSLSELSKEARRIKLGSIERKEQASNVAPSMGRIGTMYLAYRKRKAK